MLSRFFSHQSAKPPAIVLFFAVGGCSGTDIGYPRVSEAASTCPDVGASGAGNGVSGMSGGIPTGGAPSAGAPNGGAPSAVSGASGSAAAGVNGVAGGTTMGGAPSTTPFVWPGDYDPSATPMPGDGHHNAGAGCMSSTCHGSKVPFAFGGTVYKADGVTGAPNVEVGISDGALTVTAYSAQNGNIWLPSSVGALNFGSAQIVIRNANGERVKPVTAPRGSACNGGGCHGAAMRLLEP